MAANKESFILYSNIIHTIGKLSDEQAGKLFKIILEYVNDLNPSVDDLLLQIAFEPIKQKLKEDLVKWESVCKRNQENGSKGGRPKNPDEPEKPSGLSGIPKKPKKPDSDCDSDMVIKKNNNYQKILLSELSDSDVQNSEYLKITKSFHELIKKNIIEKGLSSKDIEKSKGTWYDSIRLLIEEDKQTVENIRTVYNFLKIDDFWKKNILSTSSLRKNFTQLVMAAKTPKKSILKEEPQRVLPRLNKQTEQ